MPHITLECSSNVEMDFQSFFKELSEKLVATGHAPKLGMKCRKVISDEFFIIDGNPHYKMANLLIRLREGRSKEILTDFSVIGMQLMEKYLQHPIQNKEIILSTEIRELIKGIDLTSNSIR